MAPVAVDVPWLFAMHSGMLRSWLMMYLTACVKVHYNDVSQFSQQWTSVARTYDDRRQSYNKAQAPLLQLAVYLLQTSFDNSSN